MISMSLILNADIISNLELDIKSMGRLARTSKECSMLMENDSIWENLARKIILNPPLTSKTNWKTYLKENLTIKLQLYAEDLKGNALPFPVEIAQTIKKITFYQASTSLLFRADNKMLDEVFKRIEGSFTLVQEVDETSIYYYRDLDIQNDPPAPFYFSDKNIQYLSIGPFTKKYDYAMKPCHQWLEKFNTCKNKPSTKNFTLIIINPFQWLNWSADTL